MSAPQQPGGDPARDSGTPRAVITDGLPSQLPDTDPDETQEWLDSLDAVVDNAGRERARYVMLRLIERSRARARLRRHRLPLLIEKTQRRLAQLQACAG